MNLTSMQGQSFFVTGAGSGIGRSTAKLLLQRGANVFCFSRTLQKLQDLEREVHEREEFSLGTLTYFCGDVCKESDVIEALKNCDRVFGPLSGAFNCAGILGRLSRITEATVDDLDEIISTNLKGLFLCLKHQILSFQENPNVNGLSIVNCGSAAGERGFPLGSIYAATKAGVISLTQSAARELAGSNVRVNALLPGGTLTEMTSSVVRHFPDWISNGAQNTPLLRFADPSEIARVACFLLSRESSYMTGSSVRVDGGVNC